jgi:hypothetical protein
MGAGGAGRRHEVWYTLGLQRSGEGEPAENDSAADRQRDLVGGCGKSAKIEVVAARETMQ